MKLSDQNVIIFSNHFLKSKPCIHVLQLFHLVTTYTDIFMFSFCNFISVKSSLNIWLLYIACMRLLPVPKTWQEIDTHINPVSTLPLNQLIKLWRRVTYAAWLNTFLSVFFVRSLLTFKVQEYLLFERSLRVECMNILISVSFRFTWPRYCGHSVRLLRQTKNTTATFPDTKTRILPEHVVKETKVFVGKTCWIVCYCVVNPMKEGTVGPFQPQSPRYTTHVSSQEP